MIVEVPLGRRQLPEAVDEVETPAPSTRMELGLASTFAAVFKRGVRRYVEISGQSEADVVAEIRKRAERMRGEYFGPRISPPQFEYNVPLERLAYIYKYCTCSAGLFLEVMEEDQVSAFVQEAVEKRGDVKVCAFGGGPGTELVSMSSHLLRSGFETGVTFTVVDRENNWAESYEATVREVQSRMALQYGDRPKDWPLTISHKSLTLDMHQTGGFGDVQGLFGYDLHVLNHVVSEIFHEVGKNADALAKILQVMGHAAAPGSLLVLIDRDEGWVRETSLKLLQMSSRWDVAIAKGTQNYLLPRRESFDEFQPYRTAIVEQPRAKGKVFYIVAERN